VGEASETLRMIAADVQDLGRMYYLIDGNYDFIPDAKEFLDWKAATNRAPATMKGYRYEVGGERGLIPEPFLSAPSRTGQDRFPCHPALQCQHSAGSDSAHLVLFPTRMLSPALLLPVDGFPAFPGETSLSRVLPALCHPRLAPVGDPVFRQDGTSERTVGRPLIPFNDLVDHRLSCRGRPNLT
jgi:hypothetical protein